MWKQNRVKMALNFVNRDLPTLSNGQKVMFRAIPDQLRHGDVQYRMMVMYKKADGGYLKLQVYTTITEQTLSATDNLDALLEMTREHMVNQLEDHLDAMTAYDEACLEVQTAEVEGLKKSLKALWNAKPDAALSMLTRDHQHYTSGA